MAELFDLSWQAFKANIRQQYGRFLGRSNLFSKSNKMLRVRCSRSEEWTEKCAVASE